MSHLTLVDLIAVLVVGGAFVGALSARRGLLAAVVSALGSAVICWLLVAAALAWGPAPAQEAVSRSAVVALLPPPVAAVEQAGRLGTELWRWLEGLPWPTPDR